MKNLILNINKAFDHRVRLGIMSVLMVNDFVDFKNLKELLGVTDGNLASHTKYLEKVEYIKIEKEFINKEAPEGIEVAEFDGLNISEEMS